VINPEIGTTKEGMVKQNGEAVMTEALINPLRGIYVYFVVHMMVLDQSGEEIQRDVINPERNLCVLCCSYDGLGSIQRGNPKRNLYFVVHMMVLECQMAVGGQYCQNSPHTKIV
jgi:flagellar biosynthesis regulator FlbT